MDKLLERMTPIFRSVLSAPELILTRPLNATQVATWDSLNHISLIVAIEEEFQIELQTTELIGLADVGELRDLIERKLAEREASPNACSARS